MSFSSRSKPMCIARAFSPGGRELRRDLGPERPEGLDLVEAPRLDLLQVPGTSFASLPRRL